MKKQVIALAAAGTFLMQKSQYQTNEMRIHVNIRKALFLQKE